jgi:thiol-disulfide isomerase/thioredoxin
VLSFWATWCGPCRTELPLLDRYAKMQKDAGLRIFAIDDNDAQASPAQLRRMAAQASLSVVFHFRGEDHGPRKGYPTSYVIDRAGLVREIKLGAMDLDEMNTIFPPLLKEPAPESATPQVASAAR